MLLARCDYLAENKAAPECPGPSYPNGAAAYQHAGIIPLLGAHTPLSFKRAVDSEDWPNAAAGLSRIRQIIAVNLPLGLLVVVIGASGRYWG